MVGAVGDDGGVTVRADSESGHVSGDGSEVGSAVAVAVGRWRSVR